jgi:hypothetical protein
MVRVNHSAATAETVNHHRLPRLAANTPQDMADSCSMRPSTTNLPSVAAHRRDKPTARHDCGDRHQRSDAPLIDSARSIQQPECLTSHRPTSRTTWSADVKPHTGRCAENTSEEYDPAKPSQDAECRARIYNRQRRPIGHDNDLALQRDAFACLDTQMNSVARLRREGSSCAAVFG